MGSLRPTIVACDLDGTLLRSDGTLAERTSRALAITRAAGATVVICTARPSRWLRALVHVVGPDAVAICANGGVVWDLRSDALIECSPLMPVAAREVVARLQAAVPGGAWAVERTTGFAREPAYYSRWPVPADTPVAAVEALIEEPAVKLMLRHDRYLADALLELAVPIVGELAELSHSNSADSLLEISAAGVSKASALARFCAQRAVDPGQVVAFGDMPNDLPMLTWAGHGVAVANAHPEVLEAADEITASNDDAGVAQVLERLFAP